MTKTGIVGKIDRLKEIQGEILNLIHEAERIVKECDHEEWEILQGHWITNMKLMVYGALEMRTMSSTIRLLERANKAIAAKKDKKGDK